jgi:hypothetical protein
MMNRTDSTRTPRAKRRDTERATARKAKRQLRAAAPRPAFTRAEVSA